MVFKFLVIVLLLNSKCFGQSSPTDQPVVTSTDPIGSGDPKHIPSDKSNDPNSDKPSSEPKSSSNETTINRTVIEPIVDDLPAVPTPSPPNEMLSFEEWRKKIAEKAINLDQSSQKSPQQTSPQSQQSIPIVAQPSLVNKPKPIAKRARNFASYECGAKVVDSNPESESVQRLLNEQTDEYMLNPCKADIWFVVELCETIQPKNIEIANFELYSSVPKEIKVEASDQYPPRDEWSPLGTFIAADERSVQRFQLINNGFVKFVKISLLSHYGSEHFCPLSVVRVFGTSLFEEVERIDSMDSHSDGPTDEDSESPLTEEMVGEIDSTQNLFGTAKEAVFNMVRKAAQALNGHKDTSEEAQSSNETSTVHLLSDLELEAIRLFPKVQRFLKNCSKSDGISLKCSYLKTIFGVRLYDLLIDQSFSCDHIVTNHSLTTHCTSQSRNDSNISIKVEPSYKIPNVDIISPTKPIVNELEPKSVETTPLSPEVSSTEVKSSVELESTITHTLKSEVSSASSAESSVVTNSETQSSEKSEDTVPTSSVVTKKESEEIETQRKQEDTRGEEVKPTLKIEEPTSKEVTDETITRGNAQPNQNGYQSSGQSSKESVVIRLSNKIKALEVNLSLSSQYLEELSLRYRKQMEEMQRAFNITISKMNDTNIRAAERDLRQQESIAQLESKLNALNSQMSFLLAERESLNWHYIEVHIFLMIVEVVVVVMFLFVCISRLSQRIQSLQTSPPHLPTPTTPPDPANKVPPVAVSPHKRAHPISNPCHLPTKAPKVDDDTKPTDPIPPNPTNKLSNSQLRKIRKKKKKLAMNGIHLSNSLESEGFGQSNGPSVDSNASLISKSQSTPTLVIKSENAMNGSSRLSDSSCYSSTSGVSSTSGASNVLNTANNKKVNNDIKTSKKSPNDRKSSSDKSKTLTLSLKKLLKIERK